MEGVKPRHRLKKNWKEVVELELKRTNLNVSDAQDCKRIY